MRGGTTYDIETGSSVTSDHRPKSPRSSERKFLFREGCKTRHNIPLTAPVPKPGSVLVLPRRTETRQNTPLVLECRPGSSLSL